MIRATFVSSLGPGYASLGDPPGSSALVAAVSWIEGTLLGTVATGVAVIAVATVGLMMLGGRLSVRPGLRVILGSFILFGAPTIARGIHASATGDQAVAWTSPAPPPLPPVPATPGVPDARPADHDPFAGAAVLTD